MCGSGGDAGSRHGGIRSVHDDGTSPAAPPRARPGHRTAHRARRRVPGRPARPVGPRPRRASPGSQGGPWRPGLRARTSLPARRSDPVRRRDGRLLQARSRRGGPPGCPLHRLLRRALHGRVRRHPDERRADGDPARPRGRMFDGRHGGDRPGRGRVGAARGCRGRGADGPGHLHELLRRDQGLHRSTRRHRVHELKRPHGARLGVRPGRRRGRRRQGPLPARPAPRPQHRGPRARPLAR